MGSLKDYMYKRAAMSTGPGPKPAAKPAAKPAYTPQDSINFERQGKNFDANVKTFKRLGWSKDVSEQDTAYEAKLKALKNLDSMTNNPYASTWIEREKKKKKK